MKKETVKTFDKIVIPDGFIHKTRGGVHWVGGGGSPMPGRSPQTIMKEPIGRGS